MILCVCVCAHACLHSCVCIVHRYMQDDVNIKGMENKSGRKQYLFFLFLLDRGEFKSQDINDNNKGGGLVHNMSSRNHKYFLEPQPILLHKKKAKRNQMNSWSKIYSE